MTKRLLVAHATDLTVRGFHTTTPDRRTPSGLAANGLLAAAHATLQALSFKTPDLAVAVIDELALAEDERLAEQLPEVLPLFVSLGFHVVSSRRAADLVATYVQAALDAKHDVMIVGSDKRLAQLVGPKVWWYDAYKQVRYNEESVRKRFGVPPPQVGDWLALVGDESTPLTGVSGIGAKGAVQLLEAHGTLAAALAVAERMEGRAGKSLRAEREHAEAQRELANLERDLSLPVELEALTFSEPPATTRNEAFAALGFYELLTPTHAPAPCRVLADIDLIDGLASLQVLTEEPSPVRGAFAGLAVVTENARLFFEDIGPKLAAWLADEAAPKVGHDVKTAVVALARRGIVVKGIVGDSCVASHLDDPSGAAPHELDGVLRARLHRPLPEAEALIGSGNGRKPWSAVPAAARGAYACELAAAAGELWASFAPTIDRALLDEALALADTCVRMELTGMAVDTADLAASGDDFTAIAEGLEQEVYVLAGHPFNISSPKQLGEVLYDELGLPAQGRTKTGFSTATHLLERIVDDHPIVPLVMRYQQLVRLRSTWVAALIDDVEADGRVHSTFAPARSFSGRIVNSQPDLGRVPGKTPEMKRIRHAFIARPGWRLLSVDYAQLGLYVLAHLTRDPALVEPLVRGEDMHVATASAVLERAPADIGPDERQVGKVVNFATFAGQGASALRLQLGVSVEEAQAMIERFDRRYAVVRAFQDDMLQLARERGWVETIAGRRWKIGFLRSNDIHLRAYGERLARRAPHEGSVADVTRRGLLRADQALRAAGSGALPLLQVHDEVLFEVPESEVREAAQVASEAMRTAFDLVAPLRVACKSGLNWAELERLGPS